MRVRVRWRGARDSSAGSRRRSAVAAAFAVLLIGTELVTLSCGMINPALITSDGTSHHGAVAVEAGAEHGAHVMAHEATPVSHDMAAAPHDSDGGGGMPAGHHGGSGGSDCIGVGSCGAVAFQLDRGLGLETRTVVFLNHRLAHQDAKSLVLSLHRPPPRSV